MDDTFEPITEFSIRQELEMFGQTVEVEVADGRLRVFGRVEPCLTGTVPRHSCSRGGIGCCLEHLDGSPLADVHLPAAVRVAFLNALYASYLSLPLAELGRAIEKREGLGAAGVPQAHRVQ